jgi:hypothetical protein
MVDSSHLWSRYHPGGETSGKPEPGAFQAGPLTTSEVRSVAGPLESITGNGAANLGWAGGTGGEAVALRSGALVFSHVTEATGEQRGRSGATQSFFVQDGQRLGRPCSTGWASSMSMETTTASQSSVL